MKTERKAADIIIPIYNAFDDLTLCVESILKHTDLTVHGLICINDKSPDERIRPYLDQLSGEHITVIHNEENKGFSANINIGMSVSQRDVILLNSDTVVTRDWVEKMLACAYSDERIATVTPLSNNATLCSVPEFCEENEIPEGMTADDMAEVVEKASLERYPQISVANGFCMLVKRAVIQDIGNFDAETFGRGYGEENDFCYRAIQAGYIHVMCDNTFIYHRGTSSFVSEDKLRYIKEHQKILEQRYPAEMRHTHLHCVKNPNHEIFARVKVQLELWKNKKNILYVLQSDFREDADDHCGGTQFHVKDLTMSLRDEYNVFVLARDYEYINLTAYTGEEECAWRYYIGAKEAYPVFYDEKLKKLFGSILDAFQIERVHVHHSNTLSLDIFKEADERGIPIFTTLHDYYYICPTIKMLDGRNRLCIGREDPSLCKNCLKENLHISEQMNYIELWRKKNEAALQRSACLITPSESAKDITAFYYPALKDKIKVIEHGSDPYEAEKRVQEKPVISNDIKGYMDELQMKQGGFLYLRGWSYQAGEDMLQCEIWIEVRDRKGRTEQFRMQKTLRDDVAAGDAKRRYCGFNDCIPVQELEDGDLEIRILISDQENERKTNGELYHVQKESNEKKEKFHIAFIGGLSVAKGAKTAYHLIKNSSKEINWFIFGEIGYEPLRNLRQTNLVKTGAYERNGLYRLLAGCKIDLVCILPIWPETFCYTLSEALLCRIPVLVTELGSLKKRTEELRCGWSVPAAASCEEILEVIDSIQKDKQGYEKVKRQVEGLRLRSVEEMASDYKKLYEAYGGKRKDVSKEQLKEEKEFLDGLELYSEAGSMKVTDKQIKIWQNSEQELQRIENSVTYKIALKIAGVRFPWKSKVRRRLYKG